MGCCESIPLRSQHDGCSCAQLVLVSDPGQDLDDELSFIMLRYLVAEQLVDLKGIITTLHPSFDRARLARGTLDLLGLNSVPIAVGSDGGDLEGTHTATFEATAGSYMPSAHSEWAYKVEGGRRFLHNLLHAAQPKSLTLVCIASMKDPALFLRDNPVLFVEKVKEVVIMGGVESVDSFPMEPDQANNNTFDMEAAKFFYRSLQHQGVPVIVLTRHAVYAASTPREMYDHLAQLGSSIGVRLRNAQRSSIEGLWARVAAPEGSEARGKLPARCDRTWFMKTFCGGNEKVALRDKSDTIWDLVLGFQQYDTLAVLAAVPSLRERFFSPVLVPGSLGATHQVIGESAEEHNVVSPKELGDFMHNAFTQGLALNHHHRSHIIIVSQICWDNRADELLFLVMLRSFYNLSLVRCLGMILSSDEAPCGRHDSEGARLTYFGKVNENLLNCQETLSQLGLSYVPVAETLPSEGAEKLFRMYATAPPSGVTLLLTGTCTEAANFAKQNATLFREKTQRIILMGGVIVRHDPAGNVKLMPDPAAQNNGRDLASATELFTVAQEQSVPMVILSRHVSQACTIPRTFFDTAASHGGPLGDTLCQIMREGIQELWRNVNQPLGNGRGGLPSRCDREWFRGAFCSSASSLPSGEEDVWPVVETFRVYSALGLCAAVPSLAKDCLTSKEVKVRSATHHVLGLSEENHGVKDPNRLRSVLYQLIFKGLWLNASQYDISPPPAIPLASDAAGQKQQMWEFNGSEDALAWLMSPGLV
mmetsp:Transcript_88457/g.175902  ORF Transcript_88457/g.175902 Transcript_88457/m.175902 type:complete len:761 (-) Transcript_88457:16-2298(-)